MAERRLLIIDDDADLLRVLSEVLHQGGCECDTARNRVTAERLLNERRYALVLLDLFLPDTQGLELIDRVKAVDLDYPVILMSGYLNDHGIWHHDEDEISPDQIILQAERKGVSAVLEKPFEFERLRALLEEHCP